MSISGIKNIVASGITSNKIYLNSVSDANSLMHNIYAKQANIDAFIPKDFIESYGVIRGVPIGYNVKELLENMESYKKVNNVERMMRIDYSKEKQDNEKTIIPTESIKIAFVDFVWCLSPF